MCGIVGFVGDGDGGDIRAMCAALAHRGPDDDGYFVDNEHRIHFGFRRLVVLDPPGGRQPMESSDHGLAVVFNGQIYNHRELRRQLEACGHRFHTDHSDTEVLLHGYAEWGASLPSHLDGMFAFAIWDPRRRRLFCARDRFGEKPFYYALTPSFFLFGSEITALFKHAGFSDSIDPTAVQKYFAYGYTPAPLTIYRSVRKLEPGCSLTLELPSRDLTVQRYWRFTIEAETDAPEARIPTLAEELRALLAAAVKSRLEADVPLGIFLSGGVDSTAILAFAAHARGAHDLDCFTIGFSEPSFDESSFASRAAKALGVRHHQRTVDLEDARGEVPALLASLDDPFADPSILPTHLLARFAREKVTVGLSGDGGDELFAGYDPFSALGPARWHRRLVPRVVRPAVQAAVEALPRGKRNMSFDFRLRRALRGVACPPPLWNPVWLGAIDPRDLGDCFEDPLPLEALFEEAITLWNNCRNDNDVDRTLEFYTNLYLPEMILAKADRASMRASLESRAPFLDFALAEFCRRLPHGYKFRNGVRKYLLKKALRGVVPDFVIDRPKKGFGIPLASWLGHLAPAKAAGIPGIKPGYIQSQWSAFGDRRGDERLLLWADLCLSHLPARA